LEAVTLPKSTKANQMTMSIFITGGCRSGKSGQALKIADNLRKTPKLFIATCRPEDEEMKARVTRHQQERGSQWKALESPLDIESNLKSNWGESGVIVVDCITLWISNLMAEYPDDQSIFNEVIELGKLLRQPQCPIILVSNEVGGGIVPANPLSRRFRDLVGWTNQQLAKSCHHVIWMVSGIPVPIKPSESSEAIPYDLD
jgi:adenosylcobinamide kinase/adenosylcobinamide-phosphate guanylyltransferase